MKKKLAFLLLTLIVITATSITVIAQEENEPVAIPSSIIIPCPDLDTEQ
ncbi:MAG: hypothetical protein FWD97_00790 [Defluviitaleaceae bacterium]|nr:hypothetical protein [Defluviitaleaceae bacterium]